MMNSKSPMVAGYWQNANKQDEDAGSGIGQAIKAIMEKRAQKRDQLQLAQQYNNARNASAANQQPQQLGPMWGRVNMPR